MHRTLLFSVPLILNGFGSWQHSRLIFPKLTYENNMIMIIP